MSDCVTSQDDLIIVNKSLVYVARYSYGDFEWLMAACPCWAQAIFWTLYLTEMRRGEVLSFKLENVNLGYRVIYLEAHQTKERRPKRVPIHRRLVPYFRKAQKVMAMSGYVFLTAQGRSPHKDSLKSRGGRRSMP
jgi:integrase